MNEPTSVLAKRVMWLSIRLVRAGADPGQAVEQIRDLSGGDPNVLRRAQLRTRDFDEYKEDGAKRLLAAALDNSSVTSPSGSDVVFFGEQRRLDAMSLEEAFNELARREPRLHELATHFIEGGRLRSEAYHGQGLLTRWFYRSAHLGIDESGIASDPKMAGFPVHAVMNVMASVPEIVGPTAKSRDRLIRSRMAERLVKAYLFKVAGVELPDIGG